MATTMETRPASGIVRDQRVPERPYAVLVVDADLCGREGFRSRMESQGLAVMTAADAETANAFLSNETVDAIVLNVCGSAVSEIHEAIENCDVPVIQLVEPEGCCGSCPNRYHRIAKPFDATAVMRIVEEKLGF
jgi:DNA-binding NtrC family response regulator